MSRNSKYKCVRISIFDRFNVSERRRYTKLDMQLGKYSLFVSMRWIIMSLDSTQEEKYATEKNGLIQILNIIFM